MCQRLIVKEGQTEEQARRELDEALGVPTWETPGSRAVPRKPRPEGAPMWWTDDEDASQSFLKAQGVVL